MSKLYLNKNWRYFVKDNAIYLFNFVTSKQFKIVGDKNQIVLFFNTLKRGIKKDALKKEVAKYFNKENPSQLNTMIKTLKKLHIISKEPERKRLGLHPSYLIGLDRQLDFFESAFPEETPYLKQKQLKDAMVAVLGLGSIAHYIIMPLVSSGVGGFKLVDFDTIDLRNIGRQWLFRKKDIGMAKAYIAKEVIKDSRFGIKITAAKKMLKNEKDICDFIKDCDVVVHCCDYPRFTVHKWINRACLTLKKPNLVVNSGKVGPFSIPYQSACYECFQVFAQKQIPNYNNFANIITNEGANRYPELAVTASISGSLAAKEIIAYFLGIPIETHNAFFNINPFTLKVNKFELKRQKECHACSKNNDKQRL